MFKIKKFCLKLLLPLFIIICIFFNLILFYYYNNAYMALGRLVKMIEYKIEVYTYYVKQEVTNIYKDIAEQNEAIILNSKSLLKIIKQLQNLEKKQKRFKTIDVEFLKDLQKSNVLISNITQGIYGSGTYIKYNEKFYIITCAHLVDTSQKIQKLYVILDNNDKYNIELIKIDIKLDLALFKVNSNIDIPYIEISEIDPYAGSEVVVIGNPAGMVDVITNGSICKVKKTHYLLTNIIYFGNSGGAVIYKGKLVGVINGVYTYISKGIFVNYSYAVNLKTIKSFLYYIKE